MSQRTTLSGHIRLKRKAHCLLLQDEYLRLFDSLLGLNEKGLLPKGGSIEKFFGKGNVYYGSGYVSAVEQVLTGKAEAAAVSYYVFEKDKHLTVEQRSKLKVIQRQGPVASHTFCVRQSLPLQDRQLIQDALLEIVEEEPQLSQSLFGGTLVGVNSVEHLQAPREAKSQVSTLKE